MSGKKKNIQKEVMDAIKHDDVSMHSHNYFFALNILVVLSTVALASLAIILANSVVFDIQTRRDLQLAQFFGKPIPDPGFPWFLAVLTFALVVATIMLVRKYKFAYRQRNITLMMVGLGAVIALGLGLAQSGWGQSLASNDPFKPLRPASKLVEDHSGYGQIESIDELSITFRDKNNQLQDVEVNEEQLAEFEVGDEVFYLTDPKDPEEVLGIKEADDVNKFQRLRHWQQKFRKPEIKPKLDLY